MLTDLLLVDGDARVAEAMADILDNHGVRTTWVPGVGHALAALRRACLPDLVMSEYRLPDGDGLQVMQTAAERHLPVCLVSADRAIADVVRMHGVPVLAKPFGDGDLHAAIDATLLCRSRSETQLAVLRYLGAQLQRGAADSPHRSAA